MYISYKRQARHLILVLLAGIPVLLATHAHAEECHSEVMSHVGESQCLQRNHDALDLRLKQKTACLIAVAEPVDMSSATKEVRQAKRKELKEHEHIRKADQLWRGLLEKECGALITKSFGMGNGSDIASLHRKIARITQRLSLLSKSDEYDWSSAAYSVDVKDEALPAHR